MDYGLQKELIVGAYGAGGVNDGAVRTPFLIAGLRPNSGILRLSFGEQNAFARRGESRPRSHVRGSRETGLSPTSNPARSTGGNNAQRSY